MDVNNVNCLIQFRFFICVLLEKGTWRHADAKLPAVADDQKWSLGPGLMFSVTLVSTVSEPEV